MNSTLSNILLTGVRGEKQIAREKMADGNMLERQIVERQLPVHLLSSTSVSQLDRRVKAGHPLSFEEAFVGMCYVIAATNGRFLAKFEKELGKAYGIEKMTHDRAVAIGAAFLNLMALKESWIGLTVSEVAGFAAAGLMDTILTIQADAVIETCGMGGDRGFGKASDKRKSINVSTLSSFVLAALGCKVAKHGSYANTTVVGSTDSLDMFGADTTPRSRAHIKKMLEAGFCYLDAHLVKTLHDLSHIIMMETINHVVGPMTPPFSAITPLKRVMGVNEKVSPRVVARAYVELHKRNIQANSGVIVVAGMCKGSLTTKPTVNDRYLRRLVILDELSPHASIVSVAVGGEYLGDDILTPADFGTDIDAQSIQVSGDKAAIHAANVSAIEGTHPALVDYLAMNSALGLYTYRHLSADRRTAETVLNRGLLRHCFTECRDAITSGKAKKALETFVAMSIS